MVTPYTGVGYSIRYTHTYTMYIQIVTYTMGILRYTVFVRLFGDDLCQDTTTTTTITT